MPIEFHCEQCQGILQTADGTVGKQCQCPACGNIQTVPDLTPGSDRAQGAVLTNGTPYLSPAAIVLGPDGAEAVLPEIRPTIIDSADVLSASWQIFRSRFWLCTGATLIMLVGTIGVNLALLSLVQSVMDNLGFNRRQLNSQVILQVAVQVPGLFFSTWLESGLAVVMLKAARGQPAHVGDVFVIGRWYFPLLIARLTFWLMCYAGMLFCLAPGIIVALMFAQYFYLIIDRGMTIGDAFSVSRQITAGNWGAIFVLYLANIPIMFLGLLACCVGIIPAGAFVMLMWPTAYLAMTGELSIEQPS